MKVLFVSNLFPDSREPSRGTVNARLLHFLAQLCEVRVVSPRPVLPLVGALKGDGKRISRPTDAGFEPEYPTTYYVPKVGSHFNHRLMRNALEPGLEKIRQRFPFDVILGAWIYPDGCAVASLAEKFKVPFVLVAQGSDVHEYLLMPTRRRIIAESLRPAAGIIARSQELARLLGDVLAPAVETRVIYNGVDFDVFHPADKAAARKELGLAHDEKIILYVGGFFPVKNPGLATSAFEQLAKDFPGKVRLVMLGVGTMWQQIRRESQSAGLGERVIMAGQKTSPHVARYMQAADVLCVPSDNEGVPNVIYEAFACGLRVVATRVGGIPEVLCHDFLGQMVPKGDVSAMAGAFAHALKAPDNAAQISEYARQFSWPKTAEAYHQVLSEAVAGRNGNGNGK